MLPYRGDERDFDVNIRNLQTHIEGKIRTLEAQRARIATGPNAESLRENDIKAVDRELAPLRIKAQAAAEGQFWHDSRSVGGCDPKVQAWASIAIALGRYVTPSTFGVSLHASREQDATPLRVIRGRESGQGGFDMGNPSFSTAGR
jgi:hypothetical protein